MVLMLFLHVFSGSHAVPTWPAGPHVVSTWSAWFSSCPCMVCLVSTLSKHGLPGPHMVSLIQMGVFAWSARSPCCPYMVCLVPTLSLQGLPGYLIFWIVGGEAPTRSCMTIKFLKITRRKIVAAKNYSNHVGLVV
jgi:hypothetical protein